METQTALKTTWAVDPTHSEVQFKVKHLVISTVTGCFFALLGDASGSKILSALGVIKVEATIKKISNRNTISVIEDILKFGFTLFLPRKFITQVRLINLKTQQFLPPFDTSLYQF